MASSNNVVDHTHSYLGYIQPVKHRLDMTEKQRMDSSVFKGTVDMKGLQKLGIFIF